MPDKLPKGWVKTKLGEVCAPVATVQPTATPSDEFTYFDIGGIDNQSNRIAETKTVTGREAPSRARQVARTGDILFSTVRTYLKKIARIERDYPNPVASTGFTVTRTASSRHWRRWRVDQPAIRFGEPARQLQPPGYRQGWKACRSGKDVMLGLLRELQQHNHALFEKCYHDEANRGRSRTYISRDRYEIYPKKDQTFCEEKTEELMPGWFVPPSTTETSPASQAEHPLPKRYRALQSVTPDNGKGRFAPPSLEEIKLEAVKADLPETEAEKFFHHFTANGWKVGGRAAMKSWQHALASWKIRWQEGFRNGTAPGKPDRTTAKPEHLKGF